MTSYFSTSRIGTYTLRYTDEWRYDREMLNGHLYGYIVNTTNTHTMSKHSNIETLTATSRDRDAPAIGHCWSRGRREETTGHQLTRENDEKTEWRAKRRSN